MNYQKLIRIGSLIALAGFVFSGPLAFAVVMLTKPQATWISPEIFAAHYHPLQNLPYFFGFLLIGGMMMVAVAHYLNYAGENPKVRFHLLLAIAWTVVFATLIAFNYVCQTTFVHNMALHYKPEYDAAISAFSMSNPFSFCWANEMWGYAFLGVATWLMSSYYRGKNRLIHGMLIANGILSIVSALWTIADISWVLTFGGLVAYFAWNVLMIALMILIWSEAK